MISYRNTPKAPSYRNFSPSSEKSSHSKKNNRKKNTKEELILRKHLWQLGCRYRLHRKELPGCPDILIPREQIAIFCDGDFWHGRDWPRLRRLLKSRANPSYWIPKIRSNRSRDKVNTKQLSNAGWLVIHLWETDINEQPRACALRIIDARNRVRAMRESQLKLNASDHTPIRREDGGAKIKNKEYKRAAAKDITLL